MKNSIKISFVLLSLIIFSINVKAQSVAPSTSPSNNAIYSAGFETGPSSGNFSHYYGWHIGGSLQADIPVASQYYLTINASYLNFSGKNNIDGSGTSAPDVKVLPVMAGLKFFPVGDFYVQADAGAAFALNKSDVGYTNTAAFLYTPQVGLQFKLAKASYIDAGIRYQATTKFAGDAENSKIDFFGLRVAYGFGL